VVIEENFDLDLNNADPGIISEEIEQDDSDSDFMD